MITDEIKKEGGGSTEAARLADHLRRFPQAVYLAPEELAKDAGVSVEVIRRVRRRTEDSAPKIERAVRRTPHEERGVSRIEPLRRGWGLAVNHPAIFVAATSLLVLLVGALSESQAEPGRNGFTIGSGEAAGILGVLVFFLHIALYFSQAKGRIVWHGTLAAYGVSVLGALVIAISSPPDGLGRFESFFVLSFAFAFACTFYGLVGMFASVCGLLSRVRREKVDRARMGRQELLERLFEIQGRLELTPEEVAETKSWHNHPLAREIEGKIWQWTAVLGLGISMIMVLSEWTLTNRFGIPTTSYKVGLTLGTLGLMSMIVQIGLSFLGRTLKRAVLVSLLYTGLSYIPTLLPIGGVAKEMVLNSVWISILSSFIGSLILGLLAGFAATMESRATHDRLVAANDPEALLAEYVDIQQRLNPGPRDMTVMVVDAAKSSVMKSMADPYIAEWSFRAYQQLLERLADEFGGEVLSTAGDGAVLSFEDADEALNAARDLQLRIQLFNQKTNKLSMPFKLRIGLHRGTVVGQIDKVQFTDVIDIAAHVEAACAVGGICVSERVWQAVPGLKGEAIAMLIDGFVVYQLEPESE